MLLQDIALTHLVILVFIICDVMCGSSGEDARIVFALCSVYFYNFCYNVPLLQSPPPSQSLHSVVCHLHLLKIISWSLALHLATPFCVAACLDRASHSPRPPPSIPCVSICRVCVCGFLFLLLLFIYFLLLFLFARDSPTCLIDL